MLFLRYVLRHSVLLHHIVIVCSNARFPPRRVLPTLIPTDPLVEDPEQPILIKRRETLRRRWSGFVVNAAIGCAHATHGDMVSKAMGQCPLGLQSASKVPKWHINVTQTKFRQWPCVP